MNIGSRIRRERNRLGLTRSVFGKAGGVESGAQGRYESGTSSPRAEYFAGISAIGVDVLFVITGHHASDRVYSEASIRQANAVAAAMLPMPGSNPEEKCLAESMTKLYLSVFELHNSIYEVALNIELHGAHIKSNIISNCQKIVTYEAEQALKTIMTLTLFSRKLH